MNMRKPYHSDRREEQKDTTRERILEGLVKTMAQGIAGLSIPAVAREAGVSIPTIYRYFPTKRDLLEALGPYVAGKVGVKATQLPQTPDDFLSIVREIYLQSEGLDDTMRVALMSELADNIRESARPVKLQILDLAFASVARQLSESEWTRLRNIILILSSSAVLRAFKLYLGLSGEEAADNVIWAIRALAQGAIAEGDSNLPE